MGVGLKRSPETLERMSIAAHNRVLTPEGREKIRARRTGMKYLNRKPATPERRAAISRGMIRFRLSRGWEQTDDRAVDSIRMKSIIPTLVGLECVYCGEPATERDHVVPWVQGGRAETGNVVPACRRCNISKHARSPLQWLAEGLLAT
jgi:5-methylcytosine-specific restriction endonuclease McrA